MIERSDLERMRDWAHQKVASSAEPAWAWYQHMKLRETLDAILAGLDRAVPPRRPEPIAPVRLALVVDASTPGHAQGRVRPVAILPN
jgi:hypothetical protein